jgi:hypothetical protein
MNRLPLVVLSLVAAACADNPAGHPGADVPDQILYGVKHSIVADGLIRSRLEADSAFLYLARGTAELHGVRAFLLDNMLRQVASVNAPEGRIELSRPVLVARGGAEIMVETGLRSLGADEIEVDLEANTVTVNGPATLVEAGRSRSVERFRGNLELQAAQPR